VLFPYVRETIADAVTRAGFPPVHLDPINFEVLYQQQLANLQQQPAASPVPSQRAALAVAHPARPLVLLVLLAVAGAASLASSVASIRRIPLDQRSRGALRRALQQVETAFRHRARYSAGNDRQRRRLAQGARRRRDSRLDRPESVGEKRMLIVRAPIAEVLAGPADNAALVFKAEQNAARAADTAYVSTTPGWAKVRHRDGQVGFVRIARVGSLGCTTEQRRVEGSALPTRADA
jgi:hypothetical protein